MQQQASYHTVFAISQERPHLNSEGLFLLIMIPAAFLIWFAYCKSYRGWTRDMLTSALLLLLFSAYLVNNYLHGVSLYRAYEKGTYSLIEGTVENFQPMPFEGHKEECFSVEGKRFCYSDFRGGPSFHNAASHGGPIKQGLHVRIAYIGNDILRLEIASDGTHSMN